jgi:hypothetical protein
VAGVLEVEERGFVGGESGDDGVGFDGEVGAGEDGVEGGEGGGGEADFGGVFAKAGGDFGEDAMDFAEFFAGEADEVVVEFDGFEGFDEEGLAGPAGGVDDAGGFLLGGGDDGDDEAVVADGDELFLEEAVVAVEFEEAVEGLVDGAFLAFEVAADAGEGDGGVVVEGAVGEDFAGDDAEGGAEVTDLLGIGGEEGVLGGKGGEGLSDVGGAFEEGGDGGDFEGVEDDAFDAEFGGGGFGIGKVIEAEGGTGGEAATGGESLGLGEEGDGFGGFSVGGFEGGAFGGGLGVVDEAAAGFGAGIAANEGAEGFVFEEGEAFGVHRHPPSSQRRGDDGLGKETPGRVARARIGREGLPELSTASRATICAEQLLQSFSRNGGMLSVNSQPDHGGFFEIEWSEGGWNRLIREG